MVCFMACFSHYIQIAELARLWRCRTLSDLVAEGLFTELASDLCGCGLPLFGIELPHHHVGKNY
jgi:hypothetical protein